MDDGLLAGRALGGDLDSFGRLFDAYFGRIYDFSWRVLLDEADAAAAVDQTFATAVDSLAGLKQSPSFASWIFTIAHATALSRADAAGARGASTSPSAEEAFGSFGAPDPCRLEGPLAQAVDAETACAVWDGIASLNPRDYALLDLHKRQGLDAAELASLLGTSKKDARTVLSRMPAAASTTIGGYVLARAGAEHCNDLRDIIGGTEIPPYPDALRARVDAHTGACRACKDQLAALPDPIDVFQAFARVNAPAAVKGEVWRSVAAAWPFAAGAGTEESIAAAAAMSGAPVPAFGMAGAGGGGTLSRSAAVGGDGHFNSRNLLVFGAAAVGLLAFAFAGGALIAGGFDGGGGGGGAVSTATADTASPVRTSSPGVFFETSTPGPTRSPTLTPVASSTPTQGPPTFTPAPQNTNTPPPPQRTPTPPRRTPTPEDEETPTPEPGGPTPTIYIPL